MFGDSVLLALEAWCPNGFNTNYSRRIEASLKTGFNAVLFLCNKIKPVEISIHTKTISGTSNYRKNDRLCRQRGGNELNAGDLK